MSEMIAMMSRERTGMQDCRLYEYRLLLEQI